jgi:hypothetical protein
MTKNAERDQKISELYDDHSISFSHIGAKLGITRNAVAGACKRMGKTSRGGLSRPSTPRPRAAREKMPRGRPAEELALSPGDVFGSWTLVAFSGRRSGNKFWLCHCRCGENRDVQESSLRNGLSQSCGCTPRQVKRA